MGATERDQDGTIAALKKVAAQFAVAVTPHLQAQIDPSDPQDPIARQFLPDAAELVTLPHEREDPIGDTAHSPVAGIVHRYPDRALLKLVNVCPVYCRFCFRREMVGPGSKGLSTEQLDAAIEYIAQHPAIWEVILTGGDPLIVSPRRLKEVIARLNAIPHLGVIRIHSRVPVVDPARITDEMIDALKSSDKAVWLLLHANHAREFVPEAVNAIRKLVGAGVPMLGQSVLLKGINDSPAALTDLFRAMVANRIKPHYLHHGDLARGTSHFRVSLAEGQQLMRRLRGHVSGLLQPTYILDIPGGHGKVPVGPVYAEPQDDGSWQVSDPWGCSHQYDDPATR
ncbi:MAG: lysine-2,3-aminomutase-like protein [Ferrovibrio sp.]|uniref:lysine-2,3-aminomutase-like protein n=1 Tax=Ferrovibrio sp. TaxID=1917215 RepID=UPI00262629BC|nr:lysine-2,3-aminomutase-like protein [Ferrovibrio sp.]MCW0231996.1 lysine-2,3-aminomutase-like protein [Ferrovibrio sp.]